ncbi:MAG: hypothetical protein AAGE59_06240 [Cyanobacteria bacterium P01_F01_bin.86]
MKYDFGLRNQQLVSKLRIQRSDILRVLGLGWAKAGGTSEDLSRVLGLVDEHNRLVGDIEGDVKRLDRSQRSMERIGELNQVIKVLNFTRANIIRLLKGLGTVESEGSSVADISVLGDRETGDDAGRFEEVRQRAWQLAMSICKI